jgi:L-fuculose-phosphate aldolase
MSDLIDRQRLAREIVAAARDMYDKGLTAGTSGNLSARIPGGMVITPSGIPYDQMSPDDLVTMGFDGPRPGLRRPSTEWRLHAGVLDARPDVGAVLHAHPPFATAIACHRRAIPAFHYMVAVAGGDSIPCAPYATFGTRELATGAVETLEGRTACLLANHGLVVVGPSPLHALSLALEIEALAAMYWRALQIGEPALLTAEDMEQVAGRFRTYGQG